MSFGDLPFLLEIKGGSLYISLSNGWFCIKCHLLIKIFLTLGSDGLCCVGKGINQSALHCQWFLLKCRPSVCQFDFCKDLIYQIVLIASDIQIWFEVANIFFKVFLWRVGSKKPEHSAFYKSFFHAWSVTGSVVRVSKLFSRFKMPGDVSDRILVESLAFENNSV